MFNFLKHLFSGSSVKKNNNLPSAETAETKKQLGRLEKMESHFLKRPYSWKDNFGYDS